MRYIHVLLCAAMIGFMAGLIYSTQFNDDDAAGERTPDAAHIPQKTLTQPIKYNLDDPNLVMPSHPSDQDLPDCSSVNTMPCTASPENPVKDELDSKPQRDGLFKKNEEVTCIYNGVFWWDNKDEFVKSVPVVCKVVQASEPWDDLEPNYQHIQVDCTKDLEKNWITGNPGTGMVPNHKLNYKVRWFNSNDCYHFVQH